MTSSIWENIASTPWWVYVLFIYLIRIGFLARKPRIVPIRSIMIMPGIFFVVSVAALCSLMEINTTNLSIWFVAILLGSFLGWLQFRALKIKAIRNENKLYVPGTWSLLVIVAIILGTKYYFGYQLTFDPHTLIQPEYIAIIVFLYGLFVGLFMGRVTYALRCVKAGPFVNVN